MIEEILAVAELLHAAVLAPDTWSTALMSVAEVLGGDHATLLAVGGETGSDMFACAGGLSDRDLGRLTSPEAMQFVAPSLALMPAGVAFSQSSAISDRQWERDAFYNEFIKPLGVFYGMGFLQPRPTMSIAFASCRARRAGAFDDDATARLQMLMPHFTTTLDLQRRLRAAEQGRESLTRMLDRLEVGVIVTDAVGRPSYVNACAAAIVAETDGLRLDDTRLVAATPATTRQLAEAIFAVAANSTAPEHRCSLPRPSRRPALLLTLLPIGGLDASIPGTPTPRVAIFITEPDAPVAIDRSAVARAFHLTRRESEVAALLAGGLDLEAIAAQLGLGVGTVRNHLKRAFDKTSTRSQSSLVALIRGFTDRLR